MESMASVARFIFIFTVVALIAVTVFYIVPIRIELDRIEKEIDRIEKGLEIMQDILNDCFKMLLITFDVLNERLPLND